MTSVLFKMRKRIQENKRGKRSEQGTLVFTAKCSMQTLETVDVPFNAIIITTNVARKKPEMGTIKPIM